MAPSSRVVGTEPPYIEITLNKFSHVKGATNLALGARWGPPLAAIESLGARLLQGNSEGKDQQFQLHRYGEVKGLDELREQVAEELGLGDDVEVMVTAGANQAFVNAALCLFDEGDAAVLVAPYYFSHLAALQLAGARGLVSGGICAERGQKAPECQ